MVLNIVNVIRSTSIFPPVSHSPMGYSSYKYFYKISTYILTLVLIILRLSLFLFSSDFYLLNYKWFFSLFIKVFELPVYSLNVVSPETKMATSP